MSPQIARVELITEREKLVAGREQWVDVLIRVTPAAPELAAAKRLPMNLALVLDRSGSMQGEKMRRAIDATGNCIDHLLPTDRVSVVIFDDQVDVLVPSQEAVNRDWIKKQLTRVRARNTTALHEAWVRGGMQVSEHLDRGAINRVLLITDGLANVGETNTDRIVTQARGLAERGVSTSTIGIGQDFNENLLLPMAQAAGGNAWHVERPEDMQRLFSVELQGMIAQVAHSVTLGLIPADGVQITDLLNDFDLGETGRYQLPNLQAGRPLDVVVRLKVPARAPGTRLRLLDVKLGYTPQEEGSAEVQKSCLEISFDEQAVVDTLSVDYDVRSAAQLLMNARARREAMDDLDAGLDEMACLKIKQARQMTADLMVNAISYSSADLNRESEQLAELEGTLLDDSMRSLNRKRLAYQDYSRRHGKDPGRS